MFKYCTERIVDFKQNQKKQNVQEIIAIFNSVHFVPTLWKQDGC